MNNKIIFAAILMLVCICHNFAGSVFENKNESTILSFSISPDGNFIALGDYGGMVSVLSLPDFSIISEIKEEKGFISSVDFSPFSDRVVYGSSTGNIGVFDILDSSVVTYLKSNSLAVNAVGFSPDGNTIVSGGADKIVRLWDIKTGSEIGNIEADYPVLSVSFGNDGKLIAFGGWGKSLKIYDLEKMRAAMNFKVHGRWVRSVQFSPGSAFLAAICDEKVRLWSLKNGEEIGEWNLFDGNPTSLLFNLDGSIIAVGLDSGLIFTINIKTGELNGPFGDKGTTVKCLAFSHDGNNLFLAKGKLLQKMSLLTKKMQ